MATTAKDFNIFKREVLRWVEHFQISDWDISIMHYNASESESVNVSSDWKTVIAWCGFSEYGDRVVSICLNKEYVNKEKMSEKELSKSALHEVLHVLIRPVYYLACSRFGVNESAVDDEMHGLIARLENSLTM